MKTLTLTLAGLVVSVSAHAQVQVDSYTRRDGTFVPSYYRSEPDGDRFNNYSTQGNTNPYTGTKGTENPYEINSAPLGGGKNILKPIDSYKYRNILGG